MKARFHFDLIIMIVCSVLLVALILFGSGCCKNPSDSESETVTDIDGNEYRTVRIGNQVWMAENLKVTHYRNGDAIPNVTDQREWYSLETGAYCDYDNNTNNAEVYGRLYNWYALADSRGIAPEGWRVPRDGDWKLLEMHLGMSQTEAKEDGWRGTNEGGKLKESGNAHWQNPNTRATNTSGFAALPGGCRFYYFEDLGCQAFFWSSLEEDNDFAWYRSLYYANSRVYRYSHGKIYGFSVRFIKDL